MSKSFAILLCIVSFALFSVVALAQSSSSLVLDAASLTPVNVDAVTGLSLDPIVKDRSNRPCARIKLHINRMTPEEIREIEVRSIGGNVIVMKQQPAHEGNGLIIELTASPVTRFYLHHDKYGDSNQVSLDLQGGKEYLMEGWNESKQSIVICYPNMGTEVYLDGIFRGQIGYDNLLTILDVSMGVHELLLKSVNGDNLQRINISPSTVYFNIPLSMQYGSIETDMNIRENDEVVVEAGNNKSVSETISGDKIILSTIGVYPKISAGVMLGYVKRIGGYVKFRSNFNFTNSSYTCTSNGATENGDLLLTTGESNVGFSLATVGGLVRLTKNLYSYVGVGYSDTEVLWEDYKGKWVRVVDYSNNGLAMESGIQFKFEKAMFTVGISAMPAKQLGFELGIGFVL